MDSGILMIQDSIRVCSPDPRIPHTARLHVINLVIASVTDAYRYLARTGSFINISIALSNSIGSFSILVSKSGCACILSCIVLLQCCRYIREYILFILSSSLCFLFVYMSISALYRMSYPSCSVALSSAFVVLITFLLVSLMSSRFCPSFLWSLRHLFHF
jgi:hypothetical protein